MFLSNVSNFNAMHQTRQCCRVQIPSPSIYIETLDIHFYDPINRVMNLKTCLDLLYHDVAKGGNRENCANKIL